MDKKLILIAVDATFRKAPSFAAGVANNPENSLANKIVHIAFLPKGSSGMLKSKRLSGFMISFPK